ncbi:hypothetical protein [Paenibacillus alkalitolerans]|uniref:hypothetical protein n=1 Tax=Paenibacillus alkalitolerans TaxID=2799335 RepID=UPI0018F7004B|nr:hypothetical protein [Paenibacillus alkalitolerans]
MTATILTLLAGFVDNLSLLLLAFSIYRLPMKYNIFRLISSAAVLTAVNYFQKELLGYTDMYILVNIIVGIILVAALFQLPIAYSALIMATGYIVFGVVQTAVILIPSLTGLIDPDQLQSVYMIIPSTIVISIILFVIHKKKLGFMLIANRFTLKKDKLKPRDFFIAGIFISTVALTQTAIVAFYHKRPMVYELIGLIVVMIIGLIITYLINMKEIEERYLRRKK